jgi:DMSO/TMAO reductase YedYZ molybdopterin-dependent catalytic subunit
VALLFNFLLRLGGIAAFPPESALNAFLRIVPASIEEPAVQLLGDFAGQLGLLIATLIAAAVYGAMTLAFDLHAAKRIRSAGLGKLETLLVLGAVPWVLFGLALFPLDGDSIFGVASPVASAASLWVFPFTFLLVQGVFALALSRWYDPRGVLAAQDTAKGPNVGRREFIEKGAIGVLAVLAALVGLTSLLQLAPSRVQPTGGSQPIDLADAPAIFRDPRLTNFVDYEVTPNEYFYRVAVDIIDPTVDASTWALAVDGLVNSPKKYSLPEVQALPGTSQYTTFECVSNVVNGGLIGNAKWGGVKISDLLADAGGVQAGAKYLVFYGTEGYSVGIPIEKAMMDDSILAYNMNDQPLPARHGFPLRGVIPGLYGMMSCKWVNRVSVLGSVYSGFWQTRGWTNDATISTETFIVEPETSQVSISQNGGSIIVAGYAFAGDRGVSKVEVSFDGGRTWQQAVLKKPISNLTWTLWAYEWAPPGPGGYQVVARSTDGTGQVQTSVQADPFPGGATGYAAVTLQVVA